MARVKFEIEFPTLTVDDLKALVVANDISDPRTEDGDEIDYHAVTGADVLSLWFSGLWPTITKDGKDPIGAIRRENGVMLVGEEYVHVNEMEE